jgi:hypothetical protein
VAEEQRERAGRADGFPKSAKDVQQINQWGTRAEWWSKPTYQYQCHSRLGATQQKEKPWTPGACRGARVLCGCGCRSKCICLSRSGIVGESIRCSRAEAPSAQDCGSALVRRRCKVIVGEPLSRFLLVKHAPPKPTKAHQTPTKASLPLPEPNERATGTPPQPQKATKPARIRSINYMIILSGGAEEMNVEI